MVEDRGGPLDRARPTDDPVRPGASPPPLVSIVLPVFNGERYIARAIRSALRQTYPHLEILVVDDGSTDGTGDVIRRFPDPRIRCLRQSNRGQGAARNAAIRASAGRYITFLDADDLYLPEKVARQVAVLEARAECGAVFCTALHVYAGDPRRLYVPKRARARLRSEEIPRVLLRASIINPNTLMVRGDTLRDGLFFREDRYYPEEWDLCLRLARSGCRFACQHDPLVVVEVREDSNTAMEIQWILKHHTLEMFKRLFAEMTPEEQAAYGRDRVLSSCRAKLAWAVLVASDPPAALGRIVGELQPSLRVLVGALLKSGACPALKAALVRAWRLRQRLSLVPVCDPAAERALELLHAPSG